MKRTPRLSRNCELTGTKSALIGHLSSALRLRLSSVLCRRSSPTSDLRSLSSDLGPQPFSFSAFQCFSFCRSPQPSAISHWSSAFRPFSLSAFQPLRKSSVLCPRSSADLRPPIAVLCLLSSALSLSAFQLFSLCGSPLRFSVSVFQLFSVCGSPPPSDL
jgi:hypothetical protein